jgi:fructosamine-3-kinase
MTDWRDIADRISAHTGLSFIPEEAKQVGGGCINSAVRLSDGEQSYFVKFNDASLLEMFEAESAGLDAICQTATIRAPKPICSGVVDNQAYLVMEALEMGPGGSEGSRKAGRQLADMHRRIGTEYGWYRNNTIGSTPQPNEPRERWIDFWREQRLGFQLELAGRNGYGGRLLKLGDRLMEKFPQLMDHDPEPSLLHGDLWSGNIAFDRSGEPVIFDPAVYYGDREADLAMTELFGGFGGDFYAAYREAWPLDPGYEVRKSLYNLYHIINHTNLFGGGYHTQAIRMTERLLAELS